MKSLLRLSAFWEYLKGALWVLPTLFVVTAIVAGSLLADIVVASDSALQSWVFSGSASSARGILSVIAGAMITVTGLTFSMTVVALQMASSQYSPRVLRAFLTDRGNQVVLSLFLATFAYCLAVIRVTRGEGAVGGAALPQLAVTAGFVLTIAAMAALVYFLHHLTQQLRVETIMREIVNETLHTIGRLKATEYSQHFTLPTPPATSRVVPSLRSGYLQAVDLDGLAHAAERRGMVVRLRIAVGQHITEGTTLAWVWTQPALAEHDDAHDDEDEGRTVRRLVHDHLHLGQERTMQQDLGFGLRQLVDIASKALSPGINDPTTAVEAIARSSQLLCRLATVPLGDRAHIIDGVVRAIVPQASFAECLALACAQPRRYGSSDPAVLRALLAMLADVAELVDDDARRAAIRSELERTLHMAARELDATDLESVRRAANEVSATLLHGRIPRQAT